MALHVGQRPKRWEHPAARRMGLQLPARSEIFSCSPLSIYSALQRTNIMYYAYLLDVLLAPRASHLAPRHTPSVLRPPLHHQQLRTTPHNFHNLLLPCHNRIYCTYATRCTSHLAPPQP